MSINARTPLVEVPFTDDHHVYAKLEYFNNPTNSIKDRLADYLVAEAERRGDLRPGGTIIEASSGNLGVALARIGEQKHYKVIICSPTKTSSEKRAAILRHGAQLIICEGTTIDDQEEYHNKARTLYEAMPGSFMPDQYHNPDNPLAHYKGIGPEIWDQTDARITHFFAAASTGGTVSGAGRYLKEQNPDIEVVAVDAATSPRATNGKPRPHSLEGIGITYQDSPCLDYNVIDRFETVTEQDARDMLIKLNERYSLLVGGSAAAVAYAIESSLGRIPTDAVVVGIFADSGHSYQSKFQYERSL